MLKVNDGDYVGKNLHGRIRLSEYLEVEPIDMKERV
jgi:hypothetical protein